MSGNQPSHEWHLTETYKSLITLSIEALKTLALLNGGAAVAILAYLGNLASHAPAPAHLPAIKPALLWYCAGLTATALAFVFAYCTQLALYNEEIGLRDRGHVRRRHPITLWIGVGLALIAVIAFGIGCWCAANALVP
jgi:hypothetical protein